MSIDWNLDLLHITEFPIIQINYTINEELQENSSFDTILKSFPLRLFILSHQIANTGMPCIYLKSVPKYLIINNGDETNLEDHATSQPTLLVFDLLNKFNELLEANIIPSWANLTKWNWSYANAEQQLIPNRNFIFSKAKNLNIFGFSEEFSDHLQLALTLGLYYHYYYLRPLYFTSYILISPQSDINISSYQKPTLSDLLYNTDFHPKNLLEPIILKPIPIFRMNYISIRWIVQTEFSFIISPKNVPPIDSYILLPPLRHPLRITSIDYDKKKVTKLLPNTPNQNQTNTGISRNSSMSNLANKPPIPMIIPITSRPPSVAYQNPSYVITSAKITATTIDQENLISFTIHMNSHEPSTQYVFIQNPPISLHFFFCRKNRPYKYEQQSIPARKYIPKQQHEAQNSSQSSQLTQDQSSVDFLHINDSQLELFNFDYNDYEDYIKNGPSTDQIANSTKQEDNEQMLSVIENSEFTPNDIISEQIQDQSERKLIRASVNNILLQYNSLFTIHNEKEKDDVNFLSNRVELRIPNTGLGNSRCFSYFSFLNFSSFIGYPKVAIKKPLFHFKNHSQPVPFQRLGIPNILIRNSSGTQLEVKANTVFQDWLKELYMPYSGPKKAHFVVFSDIENDGSSFHEDSAKMFMLRFQDAYTQLGLGNLLPLSTENLIYRVPQKKSNDPKSNAILTEIKKFISNEKLQEFQETPIIFIIIGKPQSNFLTLNTDDVPLDFKKNDFPHVHHFYVNPDLLNTAQQSDLFGLALELYSQIRFFFDPAGNAVAFYKARVKSSKFNEIQNQEKMLTQQEASPETQQKMKSLNHRRQKLHFGDFIEKLTFGYRYQPPFILKNDDPQLNTMEIHVAWDCSAEKAVWINDVGDILHTSDAKVLNDIMAPITTFFSSSSEFPTPIVSKTTLSLFCEYIGASFLEPFEKFQGNVEIYSIFPAPSICANFENDLEDDDIVIFNDIEIVNGLHSETYKKITQTITTSVEISEINDQEILSEVPVKPEATCYVLSRNCQAYKVSIYRGGGKDRLLEFVRSMSYLSWLSVKPGHEKRTSSFPPHINALMQVNRSPCAFVSKFEFLPTS